MFRDSEKMLVVGFVIFCMGLVCFLVGYIERNMDLKEKELALQYHRTKIMERRK